MYARIISVVPDADDPVVTLAEAKAHLRVTHALEDDLIDMKVAGAVLWAEAYTGRRFISQTWVMKLDRFPNEIPLPFPPLVSITSITYIDTDGASQTMSSDDYTVDTTSQPGRVYLAYAASWPSHRSIRHAISITFVCGFGAASAVSKTIKDAVLLLTAHLYENREDVIVGTIASQLPMGAKMLLSPWKITEAA